MDGGSPAKQVGKDCKPRHTERIPAGHWQATQ